ncbi:MAG TPA: aminomethyl-transferring glycine dehydrogenase subunit GcvPA [Actinomycetota bacterium]|nr:aminomethyl-transferring glycine dehydrogenase subunit GcvPA [Actinomycetota bacterium]
MDYTPHTDEDVAEMLGTLGLSSAEQLFDSIPTDLKLGRTLQLGDPLSESEVFDMLSQQAALNTACDQLTCFAGGGAYDHYIPAVVKALSGRSEFVTSYTPYQPELSQGVLGALFDYQSMICRITGMEVAGAGLYDGASALVEAVRLAAGATGRKRVVISQAINPNYRQVAETLIAAQNLELVTANVANGGTTAFSEAELDGCACLVVGQPNFFGCVEDIVEAADLAHKAGALLVVHFDPLAAGVLESPGVLGADVVTGEGQCLGNELNFGGPYLGIFAIHNEHIRRLPGRVCGATLDTRGNPGYVLTLQTREQHIRREKATSNICTDQTLMAIAAGIYLSWLGPRGIKELGERCMALAHYAAEKLGAVSGCRVRFEGPFLKEFVLEVPVEADEVLRGLAESGYLVGPSLQSFPDMANCLLVAVTERRTIDQIDGLAEALAEVLS